MSWQTRQLRLSLGSDLHCGSLPLGFVARTHCFVPCHLPFFALVPAAVAVLGMPQQRPSFQQVEEFFMQCLRITPLYVRGEVNGKATPLFPWDSEGRSVLERHYLDSRYGVGLDWQSRSAKDGQLFETEVILAHGKHMAGPTVLDGYVFFRAHEDANLCMTDDGILVGHGASIHLKALLCAMTLGGNATRALGKVGQAQLIAHTGPLWDRYALHTDGAWPCLTVAAGTPGPLPVAWQEELDITGAWSVLTGRRHAEKGAGLDMDKAHMAWREGWQGNREYTVCLRYPRLGMVA